MSYCSGWIRRPGWGAFITLTCYAGVVLGSLPRWKAHLATQGSVHLPLHFATYLVSALVTLGFVPWHGRRLAAASLPTALGFVTEALQHYKYEISFEWQDFIADLYGVLAGVLVFLAIQHVRILSARSEGYR
ncbi:MAG: hypothetical protein M3N93_00055 [Acidobacteriota bacterium]|nr:hypothetical protein [Acidobacteriota bacterium]